MALTVGELVALLKLDKSGYEAGLKGAENLADDFAKKSGDSFNKLGKSIEHVGSQLTKFVTLPLAALAAGSIKVAAAHEAQLVAFNTLLGSVEEGTKLFEELVVVAARTPLFLEHLTKGAQILLAFGSNSEEVTSQLVMLGDAAMGNAQKLEQLVEAFGKVQARGTASMRELNMFLYAGVPIIDALAESLGVATDEIFRLSERGELKFEMIEAALKRLTSEGGQFAGMMEKISQTVEGKWSTAIDSIQLAMAEFGKIMLPTVKEALDWVIKTADAIALWDDESKKLALTLAGVAAAIGPILVLTGMLMAALGPWGLLATAIAGVTAAIGLHVIAVKEAKEHDDKLIESLKKSAGAWDDEKGKIAENTKAKYENLVSSVALQIYGLMRENQAIEEHAKRLREGQQATREDLMQGPARLAQLIANRERIDALTEMLKQYQARLGEVTEAEKKDTEVKNKAKAAADEQKAATERLAAAEKARADEIAAVAIQSQMAGEDELNRLLVEEEAKAEYREKLRKIEAERLKDVQEALAAIEEEEKKAHDREVQRTADEWEKRQEVLSEFEKARMTDLEREIAAIDEKKWYFIQNGISIVEAEEWAAEEIAAINERAAQETAKEWEKAYREIEKTVTSVVRTMSRTLDRYYDMRASQIRADKDEELDALEERRDQGLITEEEYQRQKEAIETEYARREYELEKSQFYTNQKMNIAEALIAGAKAVVEALPNLVLAAFVGAMTAAQVAFIAAQEPPVANYAHGGMVKMAEGGLFLGRSGVDTNLAAVSSGEYIMPREQTTENIELLEAIRAGGNAQTEVSITPVSVPIMLDRREIGRALIDFVVEQGDRGGLRINPRAVRAR